MIRVGGMFPLTHSSIPRLRVPLGQSPSAGANHLQNQHLQKCNKTNNFNYVQNQHLCKTQGEGVEDGRGIHSFS
jgi:hypothetical protein